MAGLIIPSIFTAIDKFTAPLRGMGQSVQNFAAKAEVQVARADRAFRALTPALSGAAKQFLSFASAAAISAGIVGGVMFSVNAIKDYEDAIASLSAITGLSGDALVPFKHKVEDVAAATKTSSIEVAKAFELIGSAKPDLLKSADALGNVTQQAIILSKASKESLESSAQSLAGTLNQFNLQASESARVINVLAAGALEGAAAIPQVTEAMDSFGTVANANNVSVERSVALIETLADKNIKGAEAGTKLRNVLTKMATAQSLPNDALEQLKKFGVNTKIVSDKSLDFSIRLKELSKIQNDATALSKVFGAENLVAGQILLQNTGRVDQLTKAVTGTNVANEQAAKNSDTLNSALDQLKNAWINMVTGSDAASESLAAVKGAAKFVAANLGTIVKWGVRILAFFAAWKAMLIISNVLLTAYNIALGIQGALTGVASVGIGKSSIALAAYNAVLALATPATGAFAVAIGIAGLPIWLIALAIIALIALITAIVMKWNEWGAAVSMFLGPIGLVIGLIQSFRRNWDMIKEAFKNDGIIGGLKAIGATLLDVILMPLQQVFKLLSKLPSFLGGNLAADAMKGVESFRAKIGVNTTTDESGKSLATKEVLNADATKQSEMTKTLNSVQKQNVAINIKDSTGKAAVDSDNSIVPIKLSSTLGFN